MTSLASMDLNLLVLFQALYEERNVSRAARRVGLSQSAASHALARLRQGIGDDLFDRVGHRMVPTPRAEALAGPIRDALDQLGRALGSPEAFDPATAAGPIRIAAVDLAQVLVLPILATRLAERAPGIQLLVSRTASDPARELADGTLDLALGMVGPEDDLRREVIGQDPFVCVVRCDHPVLREGLTLDRFAELPHALVTPRAVARGYVDDALARVGRTRRVAFLTPQLLSAALVVARTDLILTTAARMARIAAGMLPLALVPPPIAIEPYLLTAGWHVRRDADPLHRWVRQQLLEVGREALD
jgi:DNA-binding transcriptional LysR family regulator